VEGGSSAAWAAAGRDGDGITEWSVADRSERGFLMKRPREDAGTISELLRRILRLQNEKLKARPDLLAISDMIQMLVNLLRTGPLLRWPSVFAARFPAMPAAVVPVGRQAAGQQHAHLNAGRTSTGLQQMGRLAWLIRWYPSRLPQCVLLYILCVDPCIAFSARFLDIESFLLLVHSALEQLFAHAHQYPKYEYSTLPKLI
jgi:hypothetical protein